MARGCRDLVQEESTRSRAAGVRVGLKRAWKIDTGLLAPLNSLFLALERSVFSTLFHFHGFSLHFYSCI